MLRATSWGVTTLSTSRNLLHHDCKLVRASRRCKSSALNTAFRAKLNHTISRRADPGTNSTLSGGQGGDGLLSKVSTADTSTDSVGNSASVLPKVISTQEGAVNIPAPSMGVLSNLIDRVTQRTDAEYRAHLLATMVKPSPVEDAWQAYRALHVAPHPADLSDEEPMIPTSYLHALAANLARSRPRTRTVFIRLFTLICHIKKAGGKLYTWELNALIDFAGKGWRKTGKIDYQKALDMFHEQFKKYKPSGLDQVQDCDVQTGPDPDTVTFTTLLNLAARTLSSGHVQDGTARLNASGLPPNRISHLCLLPYFTKTRQLHGVRTTLQMMKEQGLKVGLDGVNSVLWAYGWNNKLDVASTIYRVLRHNLIPETNADSSLQAAKDNLANVHHLDIPAHMLPDNTTYTMMIQMFAYRGELLPALQVFSDMLTSRSLPRPKSPRQKRPTGMHVFIAFRALFLGFARHAPARRTRLQSLTLPSTPHSARKQSAWTSGTLHELFESFLEYPGEYVPSERLIYWILVAFDNITDHDVLKVREVIEKLDHKFKIRWAGRLARIRSEVEAATREPEAASEEAGRQDPEPELSCRW